MTFFSRILDNPLVGRQLTTNLSAARVAGLFTFANVALMLTDFAAFASFNEGDGELTKFEAGTLLHLANSIALFGLLALLLPLRLSGSIEGPRLGRGFDQIVVTGISPLRLHRGNWGLGLGLTFFILVVSLPYTAVAYVFGGLDIGTILTTYAVLFLYASVIISVTLALAVFEREWITTLVSILGFGFLGMITLIPERGILMLLPSSVGEITPLRFFCRQAGVFETLDAPPWVMNGLSGDVMFFFTRVPRLLFMFSLWACVVLIASIQILLGPLHRFQAGLNNFGTVVFPGDRKRRFLGRLRFVLSRRVELAFLYENRPRWLDRWDATLRIFADLLAMALILGTFTTAIGGLGFGSRPVPYLSLHGPFMVYFWQSSVFVFVWMVVRIDSRTRAPWRQRLVVWDVPRGWIQTACFLVLAGIFYAMQREAVTEFFRDFVNMKPGGPPLSSRNGLMAEWHRLVPATIVCLFSLFLLGRVISLAFRNAITGRIIFVVLSIALLVSTPVFVALVDQQATPSGALLLSGFAPFFVLEMGPRAPMTPFDFQTRFYITHAILDGIFLSVLLIVWWARRVRVAPAPVSKAVATATATLVLLAGLSGAASAQETDNPNALPIELVEVHRGFGGRIFGGSSDFVTMVVRNRGTEDIKGRLWLESEFDRSKTREFEVPRGTTKVIRWSRSRGDREDFFAEVESDLVFESGEKQAVFSVDPPEHVAISPNPGGFSPLLVPARRKRAALAARSGQFNVVVMSDDGSRASGWESAPQVQAPIVMASCKRLSLPESPLEYVGVGAVLAEARSLGDCTAAQLSALYDYARLGGTLILFGPLGEERLPQSPLWKSILGGSQPTETIFRRFKFTLHEWEDSRSESFESDRGDESLPLVSVRSIGVGVIGHTSIDPTSPSLPDDLLRSPEFWQVFSAAIPRGAFPFTMHFHPDAEHGLQSYSSLVTIFAYFAIYTLVLAGVIVIFFRGKNRVLARWTAVGAIALLFLALVPLLTAVLDASASRAAFREIVYYPAGSKRGVAIGHLNVLSSGKQSHTLTVRGEQLRALQPNSLAHDRYNRWMRWRPMFREQKLEPVDGSLDRATLTVDMTPFSSGRSMLVRDVEAPDIDGAQASFWTRRGRLQYSFPPGMIPKSVEKAVAIGYGVFGSHDPGSILLRFERAEDGTISGEILVKSVAPARRDPFWGSNTAVRVRDLGGALLSLSPSTDPRLLIVWPDHDGRPNFDLESDDLIFSLPIDTSRAKRRKTQGSLGRVIERDGELIASTRRRVVVVEVPITIRAD